MAASCSYHSSVVVLLLALLFAATNSSQLIKVVEAEIDPLLPICKTGGGGGGSMYVGIDFCMAALGSDTRSRDAESYRDFSIIAVDLLTDNVTSTAEKIDVLVEKDGGSGDPVMMKCLESCRALYRGIEGRQPGCAAAVRNGRFKEAQASLQKSASAAKECEAGFGKNHVASPLTVENDSAFKLAKLADGLLDHAT